MAELNVKASVNEVDKILILEGIKDEELKIDCSGDVDFTELIELLTDLIDDKTTIKPEIPKDYEEGKISIVLKTIDEIFQKYNESLTKIDEEGQAELDVESDDGEDEALPF